MRETSDDHTALVLKTPRRRASARERAVKGATNAKAVQPRLKQAVEPVSIKAAPPPGSEAALVNMIATLNNMLTGFHRQLAEARTSAARTAQRSSQEMCRQPVVELSAWRGVRA